MGGDLVIILKLCPLHSRRVTFNMEGLSKYLIWFWVPSIPEQLPLFLYPFPPLFWIPNMFSPKLTSYDSPRIDAAVEYSTHISHAPDVLSKSYYRPKYRQRILTQIV